MATLYDVDVRTINEHIKKIYSDSELEEDSTIRNFRIVQTEGSRQVTRDTKHYIEENPFVAWSAMVSNKDGTYGKPAVNSRILQLQMEFEFPEESLEAKMKRVMLLMEDF